MRREPRSLLLATLFHGAVFVAIGAAPGKARLLPGARPEAKDLELDLDLLAETEPRARAPLPLETPEPPERGDSPRRDLTRSPARVATPSPPKDHATEVASVPALEEPPPVADDTALRALPSGYVTSGVDLLGPHAEANALLGTVRPHGGEGRDGDKGAERAIRTSLREHDQSIGLGVSGPVVAELEGVARTSLASVESHAVLEVIADAEGKLVSVSVADASEDRAGWDGVARDLLARMRSKRVHVSPGSHGVAMKIAVDSREALPSGAAPGVNVTLYDAKVASGKNARSAAVSILPMAKIPVQVPVAGRPGVYETKMIPLFVPLPQIAGVFDLSDVGAPAARVIHAHATSEREL